MSTTTDEATVLADQLVETNTIEHPARTVHAPSTTRQRQAALRWFGGGIIASAAALGSVLIISNDDTSVERVEVTEVTDDNDATELDIHGIPTWWSRQGGAPRSEDVTELDIHGIPTWWSAETPAP